MRCPRPRVLLLLPWLLLAAPCAADEAAAPRRAVPEVQPIQLDGRILPGEWERAAALPFDLEGSELLVQQFRGTLMIALRSDRTWTRRSSLTLYLCPDGPLAGESGPGCLHIQYEPFEHNRAHTYARRRLESGWARAQEPVVVRSTLTPARTWIEMALPLAALGLDADDRRPRRVCALWARTGSPLRTWPGGLDMLPRPGGKPPRDFARADRWGLLEGWGDPAGPGAFPPGDWARWTKHDERIREAGQTAHHTVNLLREEWKKTKKRDTELEQQVFANFETVREHEPLTAEDHFAILTTLRFLNRHERALGLVEVLQDDPDHGLRALRERALVYQSLQRYEDAAADWDTLAKRVPGTVSTSYADAAERARANAAAWAEEAAARKADEADASLPRVLLRTNRGDIEIVLYAKDVPQAVAHFLEIVKAGLYEKTLFHRAEGDHLVQGGDPTTRKGPSRPVPAEIPMELNPRHKFWRGAVGFARRMLEVNGTQFFLMTAPAPRLEPYTCFGHIVRGQDVADRLEYEDVLLEAVVR